MTSPLDVTSSSRSSALKCLPSSILRVSSVSLSLMMNREPSGIALGAASGAATGAEAVTGACWGSGALLGSLGRVFRTGSLLPVSWATAPRANTNTAAQTDAAHFAFIMAYYLDNSFLEILGG